MAPDRLLILGGGYITTELRYYFESFGTNVTLVEIFDPLLPKEDQDVAETFTAITMKRHTVHIRD